MNKKLLEEFEKILESKDETKKVLDLETIDEIYSYFKKRIPNISEEEFDDFIVEMLENYENNQKTAKKLDSKTLDEVSGGVGFGNKITSAVLALMATAPFPAVGATNPNPAPISSLAITQNLKSDTNNSEIKVTSNKFIKAKNWIFKHPKTTISVILAAIGTGIAAHKIKHHNTNSVNKINNISAENTDQPESTGTTSASSLKKSELSPDDIALNNFNTQISELLENPKATAEQLFEFYSQLTKSINPYSKITYDTALAKELLGSKTAMFLSELEPSQRRKINKDDLKKLLEKLGTNPTTYVFRNIF